MRPGGRDNEWRTAGDGEAILGGLFETAAANPAAARTCLLEPFAAGEKAIDRHRRAMVELGADAVAYAKGAESCRASAGGALQMNRLRCWGRCPQVGMGWRAQRCGTASASGCLPARWKRWPSAAARRRNVSSAATPPVLNARALRRPGFPAPGACDSVLCVSLSGASSWVVLA